MAKQSFHSPQEGLGRFVSPQRLALIAALGVITPALAHAQTDAGVATRADSSRPDTGAATDSGTTPSPRVQVSTPPGDTCAGSFVCIPLITLNIHQVETINIAPVTGTVTGTVPPTVPTAAVATPTATSTTRRRPARRSRTVRTTVATTPGLGTPSASTEGQPVDLSTASPTPLPTPAPTPPTPETPPADTTADNDTQSNSRPVAATVNPQTGGYFELGIGGSVLAGTHTNQEPNFDNLSTTGTLRVTAGNPTPELSANGPTGRFLVRLTIGGGSGNYTISIPGTNITNASGGNNFNIIAPAGMYTATITDNATQQTTTIPLTVAATRITAGPATGPAATNAAERTVQRDTVYLPTITVRAGGRPVSFFDISGSLTWGVALERSTTRDAGGRIAETTTNVTLDTLAVGVRLGLVTGVFMIGTEGVATVSGVNRGYAQTLALQLATSSQFGSAFVFNLNAGIQVPFSDTARTGGNNPMFTASLNAGYRFR